MTISFTVLGEPQGKGRPRFSTASGYVRAHTPDKTVLYENLVKLEFQRQCGNVRFGDKDELRLRITAYCAIPKSASNKGRQAMLQGEKRPAKKPDIDNIIKAIADSLNGVAYRDDAQIVAVECVKLYDDVPRVEVEIRSKHEK